MQSVENNLSHMHIEVAGISTHYQLIGQGPVMVLLHGWGCDWQIWHTLIGPLSQNYQLLIPDLPAFGESTAPEKSWTSLEYVHWLAALLQKVVPDQKYVVVGHSFGGKIAALFTVSHPDQVAKLVLMASSGLPEALTAKQTLKQTAIQLVPGMLKNSLPTSIRLKLLHRLKVSTDHATSSKPQRQILQKIVHENIAEQLTLITRPTLLLWGTQDPETPLVDGQRFAQLIPQAQLKILTNGGHFLFLDDPHWVVTQLIDFIS